MQVAVGPVGVRAHVGAHVSVAVVVVHHMGHGGTARASDHPAVAAPALPHDIDFLTS